MQINTTDFNVKVEQSVNGVVKYICVPKKKECDHCNKQKRYDKLNPIKFATEKERQKYIVDVMICNTCYPEIKELVDNNPNRRRI